MTSFPEFGDAEAAVCDILRAAAGVAAFDATVSTDLVGYSRPARWLHVSRTGGVPTRWMHQDNAEIEVAALAEDKAATHDLAAAARTAIFAARGAYTGQGLTVYDVADDMGLAWSPDDQDPGTARYVFALVVVTQPAV